MPFFIIKGDLVTMNVDAIVNDSNVNLKMVEGVGRAIFHKAGDLLLTNACKKIGHCDLGSAVITPSFNLTNVKAIIHAVGPNYQNGKHNEEKNLRKAYAKCLELAYENNFKSIAFPLLSSEYNYPLLEAYYIAKDEILKFLKFHKDFLIYIVMYKRFPKMLSDEETRLLNTYVTTNFSAEGYIHSLEENKYTNNFLETLHSLVSKDILEDFDNADKANISIDIYKKIISDNEYQPTKNEILAITLTYNLDLDNIKTLLYSAGFSFVKTSMTDLIIYYYLEKGIKDVFTINDTLFKYDLPLLGNHLNL